MMREIVFKYLTSKETHSHEVSVTEAIEEDGILAWSSRTSSYVLKGRVSIADQSALKDSVHHYIDEHRPKLKGLTITKRHDSRLAEDGYSYHAVGNFYLLTQDELLMFDFVESFRITLTDLKRAQRINPRHSYRNCHQDG